MMNPKHYAEMAMLWNMVINMARHNDLTDQPVPVCYKFVCEDEIDTINQVEFIGRSVYFHIDGEDDPYEWDNFSRETNACLMEQVLNVIDRVSHISGLSKRV
jgi:hypothetical protein